MGRFDELFSLAGRTALVTGGNSGIGLALATALGMQGAELILVARRKDELAAAVRSLGSQGIHAVACPTDLSTPAGLDSVADFVKQHGLKVDIVVNSAGVNLRRPFAEVSMDNFDLHMAIHLRAPFRLTQFFAPAMAERRWGRIINIGSLQSVVRFPTVLLMELPRAAWFSLRARLRRSGRQRALPATRLHLVFSQLC